LEPATEQGLEACGIANPVGPFGHPVRGCDADTWPSPVSGEAPMARIRLFWGAVAWQRYLATMDARWRRATASPSETMVWLAQDSLGATEADPHSCAVTCRPWVPVCPSP